MRWPRAGASSRARAVGAVGQGMGHWHFRRCSSRPAVTDQLGLPSPPNTLLLPSLRFLIIVFLSSFQPQEPSPYPTLPWPPTSPRIRRRECVGNGFHGILLSVQRGLPLITALTARRCLHPAAFGSKVAAGAEFCVLFMCDVSGADAVQQHRAHCLPEHLQTGAAGGVSLIQLCSLAYNYPFKL